MSTQQNSNLTSTAPGASPPGGRHNIVVAPVYVAKGYARSRIMRSRNQAREEIQSWATGSMKGHMHLVRNSGILVSNILAERELEDELWSLSTERQRYIRRQDYERVLFLERLKLKSSSFRKMVERIEAHPTAPLSAYVSPSSDEISSDPPKPHSSPKKLLVHALPMLKSKYNDDHQSDETTGTSSDIILSTAAKTTKNAIRINTKRGVQNRVRFHKPLIKFENDNHLRAGHSKNTRSSAAVGKANAPPSEDRYETFIPVQRADIEGANLEFVPSNALYSKTISVPSNFFGSSSGRAPNVRRVMSAPSGRPSVQRPMKKTTDEARRVEARSTEMTQLIETIDSLHVPPTRQKKFKPKTNDLLLEIFGSS